MCFGGKRKSNLFKTKAKKAVGDDVADSFWEKCQAGVWER